MKSKWKKLPVVLIGIIAIAVCGCNDLQELNQKRSSAAKENTESTETVRTGTWETAAQTPYGAYPELVTYTLGQMSGANNSNLPDGNTYDDNAYTRYLRKMLNIQNKSVYMEREDRYDEFVNILVKDQTLPDVLVVSDRETLKELVDNDLVEDLSEVYENCTSERIKEMFESYGSGLLDSVRFNGKLMAIPETVTDHGPRLMWLRKDWMDKLGLEDPKTLEDAFDIVEKFVQNKSLFKDFVESGGFRFEYIWYRMLIKDSVWEDGITSIIAVYRDTKNKNSQAAIDWLCKCIQEFFRPICLRVFEKLIWCFIFLYFSAFQKYDPVCDSSGELHFMGNNYHRSALRCQV